MTPFSGSPRGDGLRCFEHWPAPKVPAFDRDGNLFVVAIHKGERGIFRVGKDGLATLAWPGETWVGLAFDQRGRMIIAAPTPSTGWMDRRMSTNRNGQWKTDNRQWGARIEDEPPDRP